MVVTRAARCFFRFLRDACAPAAAPRPPPQARHAEPLFMYGQSAQLTQKRARRGMRGRRVERGRNSEAIAGRCPRTNLDFNAQNTQHRARARARAREPRTKPPKAKLEQNFAVLKVENEKGRNIGSRWTGARTGSRGPGRAERGVCLPTERPRGHDARRPAPNPTGKSAPSSNIDSPLRPI